MKVYYKGTANEFAAISSDNTNLYFNYSDRYYYTENGVSETASGQWWYYDADGVIQELVIA